MSSGDLQALSPYLALAATPVLLLLLIAVRRSHAVSAGGAALGLIIALGMLFVAAAQAPRNVTSLLRIDGYALFYTGLVVLAALAVVLLSYGYLRQRCREPVDEYYVLLVLATLGAAVMVVSNHFAAFFLGLETLSISLLGLIGYPRESRYATEASIKYLILSGMSSALLLLGIALLYNQLGTLAFSGPIAPAVAGGSQLSLLAGVGLLLVGIGFKLSVVPFHLWAPDIYQGAPAPVSAFVAVASKCAVVALLLRYFLTSNAFAAPTLGLVITLIAILSIVVGNLLALLQDSFKRLLAYSSIAHLGYVLVAFLAGGALAIEAVSAYLVAYAIMTLGAFGVVTVLSRPARLEDADRAEDYRGLFFRRPVLAAVLTVMLLSLAGIPVTLGFIAKFYAITAGVSAHLVAPVTALIVGSIIGLYYYLRWIVILVRPPPDAGSATRAAAVPAVAHAPQPLGVAVLAALLIALLGLGVYPTPLVSLIEQTAGHLARGGAFTAQARAPH